MFPLPPSSVRLFQSRSGPVASIRRSACVLLVGLMLASAHAGMAANDTPNETLVDRLKQIAVLPLAEVGPRARLAMQSAKAEEFADVRRLILESAPSVTNDMLTGEMMERWGELEGRTAYDHASLSKVNRPGLETRAIRGWAKVDPRSAWERMMLISNQGADSRYGLEQVLHVIAEVNLPLAIELYHDLKAERACLMCNAGMLVITALRQRQLDLIVADMMQSPKGAGRDAMRDAYWSTLGQFASGDMLGKLEQLGRDEDAEAARVQFVSGWAARDFAACFDYMAKHFDPATLDKAILPAVQSWARGAVAEEVAAVIKQLPPNLSERSLLGLVPVLARVDPKSATDWAVSFPPSAIRTASLERAMWEWAKLDRDAAQAYLRLQLDVDTRGTLLWNFLLAGVGNATLRIDDLADLTDAFNLAWRVSLLERLSLRLADPSSNHAGRFDLAAYEAWVESQPAYSEEERTKILAPLKSARR